MIILGNKKYPIIPNRLVGDVAVEIKVNVWVRGSLGAVLMLCSLVYLLSLVAPRLTPVALIMTRERTFIAVKPDGVQRGLIGEIIKRFEVKGFKLCGMKLMQASKEHLEKHYADLSDKPFFPGLVKYMSSGPVCAMVWEGTGVVKTARNMMGETRPADSKPGSIRGDFCIEVGRNVIHGSDSVESANKEINLWFKPEELVSWTQASDSWIYEQMDIFGDPSTSWGVDLLNDFLKDRSYIRGFTPSVADSNVFASLATRPSPSFPHALRWYNHIKSLDIEMKIWVNKGEATIAKMSTKSEKEAQNYKDNYKNAFKDNKEECVGRDNKEEYAGQDRKEKYVEQNIKEKNVDHNNKEKNAGQDIKVENQDDDDIDLFGSDDDDDDEAERLREKCLAACAEKAKKTGPIAKSSVVLDIKPWSDETNMGKMEQHVRSISMDGLHWGASRLAPLAFGISKLSLLCTVEDEKVSVDDLIEKICELDDYVQSVDIQAFNKI